MLADDHPQTELASAANPENGAESAERELDADEVFHLLQNQRRRYALRYLKSVDAETVKMRDLAEQVAAWEHDTTVELLSSKQRQRVYIPLYQNHLPKLDEEGVIDYQQSRGIVTRLDGAEQLEPYLPEGAPGESSDAPEESDGTEPAWPQYYLGTAGVGSALLVGTWTNVSVLSLVPDAVAGVLVLTAVALVALVQASVDDDTN